MDRQTLEYYTKNYRECSSNYNSVASPITSLLSDLVKRGDTLIDVGCASGRDLAAFHAMGLSVFGVEPVAEFRDKAFEHFPQLKGKIVVSELPNTGVDGVFDFVTCSAVLMHIAPELLIPSIEELCRLTKSQGFLLISYSNAEFKDCRDEFGRLFNRLSSKKVLEKIDASGFTIVDLVEQSDSLGRDRTWFTVVAKKT